MLFISIHEALKVRRSITKYKENYQKLIMDFMCVKLIFWNIYLFHSNLMVSEMKVKFSETLGTMEFILKIINDWDRKFI